MYPHMQQRYSPETMPQAWNAGYSGKVVCADSFYCKHTQMRIYQCHRISQNKAKYCGKRTNQNPACIKRSAYREHNIKQSNPQTTRNPKSLSRNNTLYHWISDGAKQHTYDNISAPPPNISPARGACKLFNGTKIAFRKTAKSKKMRIIVSFFT